MNQPGILPSYQRTVTGVPVLNFARRSFRQREKCLIGLVFLTFCVVCFGGFFFLPEFGGVHNVYKYYQQIQQPIPDLLIPAPPLDHDSHKDYRVQDDRAKLFEKINQDTELRVLERPELPSKEVQESPSKAPELPGVSEPVLAPPNKLPSAPTITNGEDSDPEAKSRRDKVKEMMRHAWAGYERHAWGANEVRPVSGSPHTGSIFGSASIGATIVDSMDTLLVMGMQEEYERARKWVEEDFTVQNLNIEVSVFEMNIRFIGGFLACYALTGDPMFRDKAKEVADKLLPAFQTPTGIPHALVNLKTGESKKYPWTGGFSSILAEFGTLHLEFTYLSDITGDDTYREKVQHIRSIIKQVDKVNGLYPNYMNPKTGKWGQHHMSLGALGDSFFEYLLKAWLQSGRQDVEARMMYDDAMAAITEKMIKRSTQSGLTYVAELKYDKVEHKMDHLACFAGGLYGLGAQTLLNDVSDQYLEIGEQLTNTCHESYDRTPTKLGPESFRFTEAVEARAIKTAEKYYILRPELIESYFVLWRLTKNQKYRDWGWEAVQAIEKNCRVSGGFSGIKNVYLEDSSKDDVQQSFFLAETLKYLYLLFSDDSLLPLDKWVFNTEAHPLPIKGVNPSYRPHTTTPKH